MSVLGAGVYGAGVYGTGAPDLPPIVESITPSVGHSGGRTLVEITGQNFALPPAPTPPTARGPNAPLPTPAPSVQVLFGGVPALKTWVLDENTIRCLTPIHAPAGAGNVDANGDAIPPVDVVVQNLDDNGAAIPGQLGTLAEAYSFVRPNLGATADGGARPAGVGTMQRVMEAFIEQLQIQLLENVKWNPHTDYDPDTGDAMNFCEFASLPGLAIVDVRLQKSASQPQEQVEIPTSDTTWVARRPPVYRDLVVTIVGASDNSGELLTLEEALEMFFKKNPKLEIARDPDDPSRGTVAFNMVYASGEPITFTGRLNSSNVEAFTVGAAILQIPREDMPGLPTASIPGTPAWVPAEATTDAGWTADRFNIARVRR